MNRKYLLGGLIALAVIVVAAAAYFMFFGGDGEIFGSGESKYGVEVTSYDRTMGSPKAPLMLLEYAAPSCPHCAHFEIEIFPQFKKNWVDTGKAFYIFRVLPLGPVDVAAESMARCLPPDHYFQFIDLLFRNQPKWDPEYQPPDVHAGLVQMGQLAGMSPERVDACINDQDADKRIQQIGTDGMNKYGIQGTPTFIVNGQMHGPFADYAEMQTFLTTIANKK